MQVLRLRRAAGALWEPVLRVMVRHKINRRNEGIERLFLAQAPNQHSQHSRLVSHLSLPWPRSASVLPAPKTDPFNQPQFPSLQSERIWDRIVLQANAR